MLNILVPLSGKNTFKTNKQNTFPRILTDVNGRLLIERAAEPFSKLEIEKKIIVAVPKKEGDKYQLNKIVPLLGSDFKICAINGDTQGAVCSALLAIEELDLEHPLIISSFEQVFDFDVSDYISKFINEGVDAGVLTFDSIHPKWSYVKTDSCNRVTQAAEKMPISKNAVAGFYYYKTGHLFVEAAKSMIRKDVKTNDAFFIAPTLNEIILSEGVVKSIKIDKSKYFHINDEHALESFEDKINEDEASQRVEVLDLTRKYIRVFDQKRVDLVGDFFSPEFKLIDPSVSISGKDEAVKYIEGIFNNSNNLHFTEKDIHISNDLVSIIEFELIIDDSVLSGVDVIKWNDDLTMSEMRAYLYEVNHG